MPHFSFKQTLHSRHSGLLSDPKKCLTALSNDFCTCQGPHYQASDSFPAEFSSSFKTKSPAIITWKDSHGSLLFLALVKTSSQELSYLTSSKKHSFHLVKLLLYVLRSSNWSSVILFLLPNIVRDTGSYVVKEMNSLNRLHHTDTTWGTHA